MGRSMDTDDRSEMAWEIIARAVQVSDTLKKEDIEERIEAYRESADLSLKVK
jgi:hypothetical protein